MQKLSEIPDNLKTLLPSYEFILMFGESAIKFPELSISQSITFMKYLYGFVSKYDNILQNFSKDEKYKHMSSFEILMEVSDRINIEEHFKNMFKEMFPGLTDDLINSMTKKQFIYNLSELYKINFTMKKEAEENIGEIGEIIPILKI